jgi:hypothetical protein
VAAATVMGGPLGAGATCLWLDPATLRVGLGSGAKLTAGDQIVVAAGLMAAGGSGAATASQGVTVLGPATATVAHAVLVGPNQVFVFVYLSCMCACVSVRSPSHLDNLLLHTDLRRVCENF